MRLDEIASRVAAFEQMVKGRMWNQSLYENFVAAAPDDISHLLARVEKLEGLLSRLVAVQHVSFLEDEAWSIADEARTLLAGEESK